MVSKQEHEFDLLVESCIEQGCGSARVKICSVAAHLEKVFKRCFSAIVRIWSAKLGFE